MLHAVTLRCERLPGGAVPIYDVGYQPCGVWILQPDKTACKLQHVSRVHLDLMEIYDDRSDKLRDQFLNILREFVMTAGHGGVIHIAIRSDMVMTTENGLLYVIEFGAGLVGESQDPLVYDSMAMDGRTPAYLWMGELEQEMKDMLAVASIMEG